MNSPGVELPARPSFYIAPVAHGCQSEPRVEAGYTGDTKSVLYSVVTRLEIAKLKAIVDEIDENAFITISDVHEVMGGGLKREPFTKKEI